MQTYQYNLRAPKPVAQSRLFRYHPTCVVRAVNNEGKHLLTGTPMRDWTCVSRSAGSNEPAFTPSHPPFTSKTKWERKQVLECSAELVCRVTAVNLGTSSSHRADRFAAPTTSLIAIIPYKHWQFRFVTNYRVNVNPFPPRPKHGPLLYMSHSLSARPVPTS